MDLHLTGKVAVVTGASKGIGLAVTEGLAAEQLVTGRFTQPREVADLILLLASERAGNVTGADFVIDGGLVQTM